MTATGEQETNLEPNVAYYENWYPPFKHFSGAASFATLAALPSLSNHEKKDSSHPSRFDGAEFEPSRSRIKSYNPLLYF